MFAKGYQWSFNRGVYFFENELFKKMKEMKDEDNDENRQGVGVDLGRGNRGVYF